MAPAETYNSLSFHYVSAGRITQETCKRIMVYIFHVSVKVSSAEICKMVSNKFLLNRYNGKVLTNFWFGCVL